MVRQRLRICDFLAQQSVAAAASHTCACTKRHSKCPWLAIANALAVTLVTCELLCSEIDFADEEPLQLPRNLNLTVTFSCSGRPLHLFSRRGRIEIPTGSTLSFVDCLVRTYETEADALDVPNGPEAAYTLVGGIAGSTLKAKDSVILYPNSVRQCLSCKLSLCQRVSSGVDQSCALRSTSLLHMRSVPVGLRLCSGSMCTCCITTVAKLNTRDVETRCHKEQSTYVDFAVLQIALPMSLQSTGVYRPDPARTQGFEIGKFFQAPPPPGRPYTTTFAFVVLSSPLAGFSEAINPMVYNYQNVTCWCGPTYQDAAPFIRQAQEAAVTQGAFQYEGGIAALEKVAGPVGPIVAIAPPPSISAPGGDNSASARSASAPGTNGGGSSGIAPWVVIVVIVIVVSALPAFISLPCCAQLPLCCSAHGVAHLCSTVRCLIASNARVPTVHFVGACAVAILAVVCAAFIVLRRRGRGSRSGRRGAKGLRDGSRESDASPGDTRGGLFQPSGNGKSVRETSRFDSGNARGTTPQSLRAGTLPNSDISEEAAVHIAARGPSPQTRGGGNNSPRGPRGDRGERIERARSLRGSQRGSERSAGSNKRSGAPSSSVTGGAAGVVTAGSGGGAGEDAESTVHSESSDGRAVQRVQGLLQAELHEEQLKVFSVLGRGGFGTVYHGALLLTGHSLQNQSESTVVKARARVHLRATLGCSSQYWESAIVTYDPTAAARQRVCVLRSWQAYCR